MNSSTSYLILRAISIILDDITASSIGISANIQINANSLVVNLESPKDIDFEHLDEYFLPLQPLVGYLKISYFNHRRTYTILL